MNKESKHALVFWLTLAAAAIALLMALIVTAAEIYVRWKLNQNFTFLGGFQLEALTLFGGGLLAALIFKRD